MNMQSSDVEDTWQLLQQIHGTDRDRSMTLAHAIRPYLARTRLPTTVAVRTISTNYLQDNLQMQALRTEAGYSIWQGALVEAIAFAARHTVFPRCGSSPSIPDLDMYTEIQHNLDNYNFESSLNTWITITFLRALQRIFKGHTVHDAKKTCVQIDQLHEDWPTTEHDSFRYTS